jgi:hypothetical protein
MHRMLASIFALAVVFFAQTVSFAADDGKNKGAITDAAKAGPDFKVQGEYVGEVDAPEGKRKLGFQVIAQGDGKFHSYDFLGGLPGDGGRRLDGSRNVVLGETKDGVTYFPTAAVTLMAKDGVMYATNANGKTVLEIKRTVRKSPTLGAEPPEGATVLFDGKSADGWTGGKLTPDKLLAAGCVSKKELKDFQLHLEFQTPFMPTARGQARGNSGVYLQNRYELQVLDSFGLTGTDTECGAFYTLRGPGVNMCFPPLSWQTYDIDFKAARFDDTGKKTAKALVTVQHNGVPIFDKLELRGSTPGGQAEADTPGPIQLQDHGDPVRYRNIWVVEK